MTATMSEVDSHESARALGEACRISREGARMDHRPSAELLESIHAFPGVYRFKAIGLNDGCFLERVLTAVERHVAAASDVDHAVRETKGGRHVAVTLDVSVTNAEQVRAIYAELGEVEGLTLLL